MIPILYEDSRMIVIDKPSGLASQPGEGVRVSVPDAVERDCGFRPYLVHRLDKDTAGCLALARTAADAAWLSELLATEAARKVYRAAVFGRPEPPRGVLSDAVRSKGRELSAETRYSLIASAEGLSFVEAELGTGRMHQIRQHFAGAGWPIVADDRHGDFRLNKAAAKSLGAKRLFLYAWRLSLPLGGGLELRASMPPHFQALLARLGFPEGALDG